MATQASELLWADATSQAAAIRAGQISSAELTQAYLHAIERVDPLLRAYVTVTADEALAGARQADARIRGHDGDEGLPPFLGVTASFKDVVDVAGVPTTESCKVLADRTAEVDSPVVTRFRIGGFVVLGKTNVPEFCTTMTDSELNGTCRNPWDLERTPGGSSGGAAAALSAGLCGVAHGTDGAGSVRVPASYCGLVGIKGTRGLLTHGPEEGNAYYGTSEDGLMTRSVRDLAGLLDVVTASPWSPARGRARLDALGSEPGPLRVGVCTDPPMGTVDPECTDAAKAIGELVESLGHHVTEATPRWATILSVADGAGTVPGMAGRVSMDDVDALEPRNRPLLRRLSELKVTDHAAWVERTRAATRDFCRLWDEIDVLLTPTCGIPAPSVSYATWDQSPEDHLTTFMDFPNFAQPFNLSGQPAVSLPLAMHSSGLPVGVQLVGRHLDEPTLVALSAQLEAARPWHDRRPPFPT